jgi:metallopeptidase MepB
MLYSVWNDEQERGELAGYLYPDLFSRHGQLAGPQCHLMQLGFERPDGKRHYPSSLLLTNFSKLTASEPTLLPHEDVVTLFHELGHCMHDSMARRRSATSMKRHLRCWRFGLGMPQRLRNS